MGFTDQEHDDGVGLINMRGRVYDPVTRTFLTTDPVVGSLKIGGWNKYAYVFNNPLKYFDPSGFDGEVVSDNLGQEGPVLGRVLVFSDDPLKAEPMSVAPTTPDGGSGFDPSACSDSGCSPASASPSPDGTGGTGPDLDFIRQAIDRLNGAHENLLEHPLDVRYKDIPVALTTPNPLLALSNGGEEGMGPNGPQQHDAPRYVGTIEANARPAMVAPPGEDLLVSAAENLAVETEFQVADRVAAQLTDSRLGPLAGKISPVQLQKLANNPNALRFADTATGHVNIVQVVDGRLLRITTAEGEAGRIISVGPIQQSGLFNGIANGRFEPIVP
jgi:RHS repeat-associated protein